jgi:hypothetical protein
MGVVGGKQRDENAPVAGGASLQGETKSPSARTEHVEQDARASARRARRQVEIDRRYTTGKLLLAHLLYLRVVGLPTSGAPVAVGLASKDRVTRSLVVYRES